MSLGSRTCDARRPPAQPAGWKTEPTRARTPLRAGRSLGRRSGWAPARWGLIPIFGLLVLLVIGDTSGASTTTSTSTTNTTAPSATTTTVTGETTSTTSTTVAPTTTTTAPFSTTTTAQQSTTSTSTTTTTSLSTTTLPPQGPACGTCEHHTGDGLIDFEDPACCAESTSLGVRALVLQARAHARGDRIRVDATYAPATSPFFDPLTEDTSVQIRDSKGELVCAILGARHWKRSRLHLYRFRDRGGPLMGGLTKARFKVTRAGRVVFHAKGRIPLRPTDGAGMLVTVRVGNQCAHAVLDLRSRKTALVFP